MHIQEEQYLWDKMIEAERVKGRRYVHDLAMRTYVELRIYGIATYWQAESFWMSDMHRRIRDSLPNLFVKGSLIDYFETKETKDDGSATLRG
jgi:hypothetical protein